MSTRANRHLCIVHQTKLLFKLVQEFDKRYSYEMLTSAKAILSAILVIVRGTKPIFELGREFGGSTPYKNFGRNQVIND